MGSFAGAQDDKRFWGTEMELFYEGKNITGDVQITEARGRDVSGGRSDSLELVVEHAHVWHRWGPQADDRIELIQGRYSTGRLYINAVAAEDDQYRILATSVKTAARRKRHVTFQGKTLEAIMKQCAGECGMDQRIFGLDKNLYYPYLQRPGVGCAAFLDWLAGLEGAVLKTYSGRFTMIGIPEAQRLPPAEVLELSDEQAGVTYQRRDFEKIKALTVCTPYATVMSVDESAQEGETRVVCGLPARDPATAARWAAGMQLRHNRNAEQLTVESDFREGWSAMVRLDVTGCTAAGKWMIDEVEHDFAEGRSKAVLVRCLEKG